MHIHVLPEIVTKAGTHVYHVGIYILHVSAIKYQGILSNKVENQAEGIPGIVPT